MSARPEDREGKVGLRSGGQALWGGDRHPLAAAGQPQRRDGEAHHEIR